VDLFRGRQDAQLPASGCGAANAFAADAAARGRALAAPAVRSL